MGLILRAIWGQVSGPVALLLILALGFQTVRLGDANRHADKAEGRALQASTDLGTCRGNVAGLKAAGARQDAAVQALADAGAARVATSAKAALEARKTADAWRSHADDLMGVVRAPGQSACDAADALLLSEASR